MKTYPLIRTIYLYLFALVGLALLISGAYQLVDLGLKTYIFTQADKEAPLSPQPIYLKDPERTQIEELKVCADKCQLTEQQKQQIDNWLSDYDRWQKEQKDFDYRTSSRQRQASNALAMIIVGLPVWLYHWSIIKKDQKRKEEIS